MCDYIMLVTFAFLVITCLWCWWTRIPGSIFFYVKKMSK